VFGLVDDTCCFFSLLLLFSLLFSDLRLLTLGVVVCLDITVAASV
jgi:hypothetical protein